MNTVRSVWLGWGTLMVAGATAYYFAKKDINAHRREQELRGVRGTEFLECEGSVITKTNSKGGKSSTEERLQTVQENVKRREKGRRKGRR